MLELDDDQRRAVDAGPGELFISAGAGSGKTRVLTARFASAVLGRPPYRACAPDELLTITFTDKAAGVLQDRIRHELAAEGRAADARSIGDAWISTIHGMCTRVLRQHAFEAGLDPHFTVLDEVDAAALETAALEDVTAGLIAADDGVLSLLDAYGLETVLGAVRRVRSDVLARGLEVGRLGTLDRNEALAVLARARETFAASADDFESMRRLKTTEGNAASARAAAALLETGGRQASHPEPGSCAGVSFRSCSSVEGNDELVARCRALLVRVEDALAQLAVAPYEQAFVRLVRAFDAHLAARKAERGALDFQDLQLATAALLEARPAVAASLRDRFAMLMVDEFQDTDTLQLAITGRLARDNLCTVGDEHQSIYAFRSADIQVFRDRRAQVERVVRLATNYRTAPALLDAVNALFSSPVLFGDAYEPLAAPEPPAERRPWPATQPRFSVRFSDTTAHGELDARQAEAECIAARVAELVDDGVAPGDIVVLLGAMRGGRADALRAALERRSIAAFLAAGGDFFECREVAEARALLRLIQNPADDEAVVTVLRGRTTGISDDGLYALRAVADAAAGQGERRQGRLWAAACTPADGLALAPGDRAVLERTVHAVTWARRQRGLRSPGEIVLDVLVQLDVDITLQASGREGRRAWANLLKLVRLADEYEATAGGDLGGLLDYLAMREIHAVSEREAVLEGESSAVRVMSIHAAKGLEFPVVVIGALDRGGDTPPIGVRSIGGTPLLGMRLPTEDGTAATLASRRVADAEAAVEAEEAVRLLYVACTRAEESLTIVARTNPEKDAEASMGGIVRRAIGLGAAGAVSDALTDAGPARAHVAIFRADEIGPAPSHVVPDAPCPTPGPLPATVRAAVPVFGAPRTVSYTGLSRYASCPYSYYATAIARLPAPPRAIGTDARAFGVAAHRVLEAGGRTAPDDAALAAAAAEAGLAARDVPRLRAAVETYRASAAAAEVLAADRVAREASIAVPIGELVLAGAVDVIAWRGSDAVVVDYKTGRGAGTDEKARDRYRLQATCYALAALAAGARNARVAFVELETGREVAYDFTREERATLERSVTALTDRMRAGEYASRGTYERESCETCPAFGSLCPVTRPTRGAAG